MNGDDTRKMTMQEAAQLALDVQDACNLSGVVHSFSKVMSTLSEEANRQKKGTDWNNKHPIAVLFASKIYSLTNSATTVDDLNVFHTAYEAVQKLAKG